MTTDMEAARKAREEYNRYRDLHGVNRFEWDVCLYYVKYGNGEYELGMMRGTSAEVAEKLCERDVCDMKIVEVKLNELIKGIYGNA